MPVIRLTTIPAPDESKTTVYKSPTNAVPGPIVHGSGNYTYLCGSCDSVILERVSRTRVGGIIFLCPSCESYNAAPSEAKYYISTDGES